MTRQYLQELAGRVVKAHGTCRSQRFYVSLTGGHLVWLFTGPDRETLEQWLDGLTMKNYRWLARIDLEGENGTVRDA